MSDREEEESLVQSFTDVGLDLCAMLAGAFPWLGGPLNTILSGLAVDRKIERVRDTISQLGTELDTFRAEASENYVKTEDFQDLLEKTLRRAADERAADKRRLYGTFLANAIKLPGDPYIDKLRFLRTFEALQPDHLRVLRAIDQPPPPDRGLMGSSMQLVSRRLLGFSQLHIVELVQELNDLRLTSVPNLVSTIDMKPAEDLRKRVTPFGRRFLRYLEGVA